MASVGLLGTGRGTVRQAMAYVRADPARATLEATSRHVACSTRTLQRLFHEHVGVSFREYKRRAQVALAARLLLTSGLSVSDVAQRVGYSDGSHLAKTFQELTGTTPSAYRRQAAARLPAAA